MTGGAVPGVKARCQLDAVGTRQLNVADDASGVGKHGRDEKLVGVVEEDHVVPDAADQRAQRDPNILVVVDHGDKRGRLGHMGQLIHSGSLSI